MIEFVPTEAGASTGLLSDEAVCVGFGFAGLVLLGFTALGIVTFIRWWL
ncbi:hypothetical protein ACGFZP_37815 [Kitasatospora sp. NPDC048239]